MRLLQLKKNSTPHSIITVNFNDILHSEYQDFNHIYHIYIDASKTSVGVGFAYYTMHTSKLYKLLPGASIFTAETYAIKEALIYAKTTTANNILITSDSLSALIAIEASNPSNDKIY